MARKFPLLVALTGEARLALAGAFELKLTRFPFRVGRESRSPMEAGVVVHDERRRQAIAPNNDLYIWDPGPLLNISREHFQIERSDNGEYFVRDRGSTCGTLVGNVQLGLGGAESCALFPDNTIVVGTPKSPFVFRFEIRETAGDTATDERLESTSAREKAQLAWNLKSEESPER